MVPSADVKAIAVSLKDSLEKMNSIIEGIIGESVWSTSDSTSGGPEY